MKLCGRCSTQLGQVHDVGSATLDLETLSRVFFDLDSKENSQSAYFGRMISWRQGSEAIGAEVYDRD